VCYVWGMRELQAHKVAALTEGADEAGLREAGGGRASHAGCAGCGEG